MTIFSRTRWNNERGAVTYEYALKASVLVLLMLGAVSSLEHETGRAFYYAGGSLSTICGEDVIPGAGTALDQKYKDDFCLWYKEQVPEEPIILEP